jgi:hypothetical protein
MKNVIAFAWIMVLAATFCSCNTKTKVNKDIPVVVTPVQKPDKVLPGEIDNAHQTYCEQRNYEISDSVATIFRKKAGKILKGTFTGSEALYAITNEQYRGLFIQENEARFILSKEDALQEQKLMKSAKGMWWFGSWTDSITVGSSSSYRHLWQILTQAHEENEWDSHLRKLAEEKKMVVFLSRYTTNFQKYLQQRSQATNFFVRTDNPTDKRNLELWVGLHGEILETYVKLKGEMMISDKRLDNEYFKKISIRTEPFM